LPDWKRLTADIIANSPFAGVKQIAGPVLNPPTSSQQFTGEEKR
jgi:hypothetical protein